MENDKYSTKVIDEDITNGIEDEYGCIYSADGKMLLKGSDSVENYIIKSGTKVICDCAFCKSKTLKSIVIHDSVTSIGAE